MNRRIDKSTKNRDKETKQNTSLIDLSLQQIDSEARPQALLPLYSYLFSVWLGSFFFGGNWLGTMIRNVHLPS